MTASAHRTPPSKVALAEYRDSELIKSKSRDARTEWTNPYVSDSHSHTELLLRNHFVCYKRCEAAKSSRFFMHSRNSELVPDANNVLHQLSTSASKLKEKLSQLTRESISCLAVVLFNDIRPQFEYRNHTYSQHTYEAYRVLGTSRTHSSLNEYKFPKPQRKM